MPQRLAVRAMRSIATNPREGLLSARMAAWLVVVSAVARATSLPKAHRLLSARVRPTAPADADATAARLARAIDRVLALDLRIFRGRCWRRALVLQRFLALHGIDSRINFGVERRSGGSVLEGHAWLERDGRPFLEAKPPTCVVTFTLPATPAAPVR